MHNHLYKQIIVTAVVAVVVGGISFYGGTRYQSSIRGSQVSRFAGMGGVTGGRTMQNRPVLGDVITLDSDSITVKLADGSTKIVNIAQSTTYTITTVGKKDEVVVGTKVSVIGQTNSDGSVTAQSVQINPSVRPGFGMGLSPSPTN
ncbi:MAG: hypothetical protein WCO78_02805 [Candidatus Roizmanbacteria bacterium]